MTVRSATTSSGARKSQTIEAALFWSAANIARDNAGHNGGQYNAHHGATAGDLWTGNSAESMSVPAYAPSLPNNASAVVVTLFDQV